MAGQLSSLLLFFLLSLTFQLLTGSYAASDGDRKAYIVYMGDLPTNGFSVTSVHNSILQQVIGSNNPNAVLLIMLLGFVSSDASDSLLHSYKRSFNGFVAKLSEKEAEILRSLET
ncbi:Peptidase S8 propeptide/proteinase inhibitor I9 [Dillenia turbinata]|uniref:Peptidase S8 propeptide/proteinase inhibitor I9 n=1 Tax=Dillenia turbinata TaxID=194707 RepID=A0AAN8ZFW7_9MAGN